MKHYKATIYLMTDGFIDNDPTKGCSGELQDCGIIETIKGLSLGELIKKLEQGHDLSKFELYEDNLEASFEEYDYEEDYNYFASYSIYLTEVNETKVNASKLLSKELK